MAINKNFVIKHGVEVDTKLLVGDSNTQKVGIGTTVPQYSLHVGGLRGGIGATDAYISGVTTVRDLHVTGITTFDTGRVLIGAGASTGTRGQILHVGSATTEGGVYISGDVGLGVTLPGAKLNVVPGSSAIAGLFSGTTEKDMVRITQLGGGNALRVDDIASDASPFVITGIGSVGIGTTNPKYALVVDSLVSTGTTALFVHGDAQITGDLIVDDFSLDELDVDQINVTGILTSAQTKLNGITTAANINVTGVTTLTSIGSNLIPDADGSRNIGAATSEWGDLFLDGTATVDALVADTAIVSDLTDNRVVIAGSSGELEDDANFTFDGSKLNVGAGTGVTVFNNGNVTAAGIGTFNGGLIVGAGATFTGNILPEADGTRDIGATGLEWKDLYIDGTAHIDVLDVDETAYITTKLSVGTGVTAWANGNLAVAGVGTINGGLIVGAAATFSDDVVFTGNSYNLKWDKSADALEFKDETQARFGTNNDLKISHTNSLASQNDSEGNSVVDGWTSYIEDAGTGGIVFKSDGNSGEGAYQFFDTSWRPILRLFSGTGARAVLYHGGLDRFETTPQGVNVSGVTTSNRLIISGVSTFTSIGSNLIPDADGSRNIGAAGSEWQDLHIDGTANIDSLIADTAQVSDLTNTRVVYAGASGELSDDSTLTFNSTTKVLSVQELVGVHTSAGGGGVGIASTTAHVGYGFTYINFKGPGVSTVYASSTTGIATIFFQGGGSNAGAAGTWTPEGSIGISTSKSIGVNTTTIADADLQGIGNTFQGVYIGNGMLVTDNQLNGNHYIGTAYNGLMAGPVTVNGVLTVDGNWAVV